MANDESRLDPDALLAQIESQRAAKSAAKLRVFLGMSAGVGKTYAMLKAAHQHQADGAEVVIGIVETHGRIGTAELLAGLKVLPLRTIEYRGTTLQEMDIDLVLKLRPSLVLVDELAHSNAPGSRHEKRYQDVLELLDAGIDVYTSLNVQHLESRKDSVEAITGIAIRETVPDSILERAVQVELVDIAPIELLKRLSEGKVYTGERAVRATEGFFKEDKLTALREIALRMTAERVDQDLQRMSGVRNRLPWQTNERLLVAVSHSPYSEKLIRATRRLAYNLEAPWIAVHVDTGITLGDADQAQLVKNLGLARELRAEVITTTDTDLPAAIKRICRRKNVTHVIVGRPTRRWFRDMLEGGSLLQRLVHESLEVDVHVIRQEGSGTKKPSIFSEVALYRSKTGFRRYLQATILMAVVTLIGVLLEPLIGYRAVGFIFLLGVMLVGALGSLGAVMYAAVLSAIVWNFGFIPPRFTFVIAQPDDVILCLSYFVVALITGFLANRLRFHENLIREREERTNALYQVLQDINGSSGKEEFISKVTYRVGRHLKAECRVLLRTVEGVLSFDELGELKVARPLLLNEKDRAVAQWSYQNQKVAGWSTDTLSESDALLIPLMGASEPVGIFVFKPARKMRKLGLEQEALLFSITRQLGVSLERHFLAKRLMASQRLQDSESLHQTLLNSISHEMRTPLTAILGSASALENEAMIGDREYVRKVARGLHEAGDRLNRVIENLLDMSRLNSGVLSLKLEWQDIDDLIGVTLTKLEKSLSGHLLHVEVQKGLGLVRGDFRLLEHAISNLLLNASIYSPPGKNIWLKVRQRPLVIEIVVEDDGPGIAAEYLPRLFDKFFRVPGSPTGGTGLGLSIVKGIIEMHRGHVTCENREPHGAKFVISLPLEDQPEVFEATSRATDVETAVPLAETETR